jgi:hypothetical protein
MVKLQGTFFHTGKWNIAQPWRCRSLLMLASWLATTAPEQMSKKHWCWGWVYQGFTIARQLNGPTPDCFKYRITCAVAPCGRALWPRSLSLKGSWFDKMVVPLYGMHTTRASHSHVSYPSHVSHRLSVGNARCERKRSQVGNGAARCGPPHGRMRLGAFGATRGPAGCHGKLAWPAVTAGRRNSAATSKPGPAFAIPQVGHGGGSVWHRLPFVEGDVSARVLECHCTVSP